MAMRYISGDSRSRISMATLSASSRRDIVLLGRIAGTNTGQLLVRSVAAIAALACTSRAPQVIRLEQPRRTPITQDKRVPSASTVIPAAECVEDAQCRKAQEARLLASPKDKTILCENGQCQLHDSAVLWEWAAGLFPELRQRANSTPHLSWTTWLKPGATVTLFVADTWFLGDQPAHRTHCLALRFSKGDDELVAPIDANGRSCASHNGACPYELHLADTAMVVPGPEMLVDDTRWVGHYLSDADDSGLTYDGATTRLEPYCAEFVVEQPGCVPDRCTSCQLDFAYNMSVPNGGDSSAQLKDTTHQVLDGSCAPCLPDPIRPLVPRLKQILESRSFPISLGDPRALRFFRRRAQCETYLREQPTLEQ
jgi:hypothetical protein